MFILFLTECELHPVAVHGMHGATGAVCPSPWDLEEEEEENEKIGTNQHKACRFWQSIQWNYHLLSPVHTWLGSKAHIKVASTMKSLTFT